MNNIILWDETFETGIIEVDIQHRNFFNIIKILNDSLAQKKSSMVIKYIIEEIERYGQYHTKSEEEILQKYNLFSEDHKIQHEIFKKGILQFKDKYISTKDNVLAKEICDYLLSWIKNHILKIDKQDFSNLKQEFKKIGKAEENYFDYGK